LQQGATASLVLGLCARNVVAPDVDIMIVEFTLNDSNTYRGVPNKKGVSSMSLPYELMVRNILTAYEPAPALIQLYYWGANFDKKTAQVGTDITTSYYI
jgi:hypothetical protein